MKSAAGACRLLRSLYWLSPLYKLFESCSMLSSILLNSADR